jgi:hypothetical protein
VGAAEKHAVKQKKAPVVKQIKIEPFVNDRFAWHKAKRAGQDKNQKGKVESTFPLLRPERQWQSVSNQTKKF